MKTFTFEGKTHMFATDITPKAEGYDMAVAVDQDNIRCEMWFTNGQLTRLTELD